MQWFYFTMLEELLSRSYILCRYDNALSHISSELGLRTEERHFFEIPNPHCNLDLDEDDFEWPALGDQQNREKKRLRATGHIAVWAVECQTRTTNVQTKRWYRYDHTVNSEPQTLVKLGMKTSATTKLQDKQTSHGYLVEVGNHRNRKRPPDSRQYRKKTHSVVGSSILICHTMQVPLPALTFK